MRGLLGRLVTTRSEELAGEHARKVGRLEEEEGLRVLASYMGKTAEGLQGAPSPIQVAAPKDKFDNRCIDIYIYTNR